MIVPNTVGLGAEAVAAFLKSGDIKAAVDCCVLLNQWDSGATFRRGHSSLKCADVFIVIERHISD
jgi:hypothetical protein